MKLKMVANKLENPDVTHISLVERGANQIPFRIIKAATENGMIDLRKVGTLLHARKAAEDKTPVIVGVVVEKDEKIEAVKAHLTKAGFSVDTVEEQEDGSLIFKQTDDSVDGTTVVKMSDKLLLLVKGYSPYKVKGSFMEKLQADKFFPGMTMATQTLMEYVGNTLYTEESMSQDDAVAKVDGALAEYHAYVVDLLKNVPSTAFKAEGFVAQEYATQNTVMGGTVPSGKPDQDIDRGNVNTGSPDDPKVAPNSPNEAPRSETMPNAGAPTTGLPGKDQPMNVAATPTAGVSTTGDTTKADDFSDGKGGCKEGYEMKDGKCMPMAKKAEGVMHDEPDTNGTSSATDQALEAKEREENTPARPDPNLSEPPTKKEAQPDIAALLKASLAEALAPVQESITALGARVEEVATKADEATDAAKKADAALSKRLIGGEPATDGKGVQRKSDDEPKGEVLGLIDTAINTNLRKRASATGREAAEYRRRAGMMG